ncbi:MAG: 16S/23S rRNA (cytidine-2'-O)-methyltransferase TlyA [Alphaproteobacteria bacterium MarineAlpha2_Bin1]|nr:MAG: 16S/23S rRNA (cytidine-2'-O)-methyltransferase TlyA [Alphaproteobacteria bacterium MarineAlpha2_Bin1]|tara:strand:- start:396 stop:1139 length:744 start_codon:yes stop_codon:yes gene_type:complete
MKEKKIRLDQLLTDRGLAPSRARASSLILSGCVLCNNIHIRKAGYQVKTDSIIRILRHEHEWVSRGGVKLNYALNKFKYSVQGVIAADIGSSTGGFTDVLLKHGAKKIYSIDVGYGQLSWKLRQDKRVIVMERVNSRYLDEKSFSDLINFIVCDVSFISIKKALPPILKIVEKNSRLISLIKPQFEAGKKNVKKGGVVRDTNIHNDICKNISLWLQDEMRWSVDGLCQSPICGPAGNKEFFISAKKI